jgi:hypothetical protein
MSNLAAHAAFFAAHLAAARAATAASHGCISFHLNARSGRILSEAVL